MPTTLTNNLDYSGAVASRYIFQPLLAPSSTMSEYSVFPNVEGKIQVPKISSLRKSAQDGANCGWAATSTITLSDQEFLCLPVKHNIEICKDDLKQTYAALQFRMNDNEGDLTGNDAYEAILEQLAIGFNRDMMDIIWWGANDNSHSDAGQEYLDYVDGLYFNINADTTMRTSTIVGGGLPVGTGALGTDDAIEILEDLYTNANSILKQVPKPLKRFYVTGSVYENLEASMTGTDTAITGLNIYPSNILEGLETLSYKGIPVIPDWSWDQVLSENSTSLPFAHAAFYTTPQNLGIATNVDAINITGAYDPFEETMKVKARYDLDTNVLHTELILGFKST